MQINFRRYLIMNNDITVELDNKIENCLIDFHKGGGPADYEYLVEKYISTYHYLLYRTIKKLENYFDNNELYFLFDILNTGIYSPDISPVKYLLYESEDALNYEPSLGEKWNINKNIFIEKIKSLSEFQAFSIIMIVYKFWRNSNLYKNDLSLLFKENTENITK